MKNSITDILWYYLWFGILSILSSLSTTKAWTPSVPPRLLPKQQMHHCQVTLRKLIHWSRVTHICIGNLTIIGSNNVLVPGRRQAIISTIDGTLLMGQLGIYLCDILIKIQIFGVKKAHLKMSAAKWQTFCLILRPQSHIRTYQWLQWGNVTNETRFKWITAIFPHWFLYLPQYHPVHVLVTGFHGSHDVWPLFILFNSCLARFLSEMFCNQLCAGVIIADLTCKWIYAHWWWPIPLSISGDRRFSVVRQVVRITAIMKTLW